MHRYELSTKVVRAMKRMPKDRVEKIMAAFDELVRHEEPARHHNVKLMSGDWSGYYRLRIGSYRAIFGMSHDELTGETKLLLLTVIAVGTRQSIY